MPKRPSPDTVEPNPKPNAKLTSKLTSKPGKTADAKSGSQKSLEGPTRVHPPTQSSKSKAANAQGTSTDAADESDQGDFRRRVLDVIRQIPLGKVATYGQVSKLAGHPRAARQVGRILYGLKDHERDVPWQRVINAQGSISTWRVGVGELQEAILKAEGVEVRQGHCKLKRFQWQA